MVVSVWRPGPKTSRALPSRKNTAHWVSCTTSWAPTLISPPISKRWTISFPVSSSHSITSMY